MLPFDYAIRNLGRSPLRLTLSVGSCAASVLLVVAGVGFVRGMDRALTSTGLERNVILLGTGSEESVERSEIPSNVALLAESSIDGIRALTPGSDVISFLSPEVHLALPLGTKSVDSPTAIFRGVTPAAHLVHPQVRIIEGRSPEPGTDEIMLGRDAAARAMLAGLNAAIGGTISVSSVDLRVVGVFAAPGTAFEGEIWIPLATLKSIGQRTTDSCVVMSMNNAEVFADVEAFAASRVDLELVAIRESDYYAALGKFLAPIRLLVLLTAAIVAFGAVSGALGTLDVAFAARVRELGTLQALGFRRRTVGVSLLQESMLIVAAGGIIGSLAAHLFLHGAAVRSSMGTFGLVVDAPAIAIGFAVAIALGLLGAMIPACRLLRRPIPGMLRAAV